MPETSKDKIETALYHGIRGLMAHQPHFVPASRDKIQIVMHPETFADIYKTPGISGLRNEGSFWTWRGYRIIRDEAVPEGKITVRFQVETTTSIL